MSPDRAPPTHVFVYGTLMRGQPNHRVLVDAGARFVAAAETAEPRTLVDLGPYPALLPRHAARDATRVTGELYEIDEEALAVLDEFEGCPDLYTRERIGLTTETGPTEAWTYVFARPVPRHARVIAGGRYAGGGLVLVEGAREATDLLDKEPTNEDGSRSREP